MTETTLEKLRALDFTAAVGATGKDALISEWSKNDVRFVINDAPKQAQYYRAVRELFDCIKTPFGDTPILQEGGVYFGTWLESTGTINSELMQRFLPHTARETFRAFAKGQRDDGMIPYKITADGPVFNQIQLVTPLARCVWHDYLTGDRDHEYLAQMYSAMSAYDDWISTYRDTRGTGAVEAFCTFDTGHDLSSRFWHVPDYPRNNDGRKYQRDNPFLPMIAPDLTANVACQRGYLALIAAELGHDPAPWRDKATASITALHAQCYDEADGFFYDRDREGRLMRVQSDVLLRILACEIGDAAFFTDKLERYLLNTRKFFARYPFTSIALDDPRFDHNFAQNSWSGPSNFLSIIRAPHAFEHHHRHVELTWVLYPILHALFEFERFAQTINPFSGAPGFTEAYSPTILCLLDFAERVCGIQPRPDGSLWFTGLLPYETEGVDVDHETGYSRRVDGTLFEMVTNSVQMTAYRDRVFLFSAPKGVRVMTDRAGEVLGITGMSVQEISGELQTQSGSIQFSVEANQELSLANTRLQPVRNPGLVLPQF